VMTRLNIIAIRDTLSQFEVSQELRFVLPNILNLTFDLRWLATSRPPIENSIISFYPSLAEGQNKLERLTPASFFRASPMKNTLKTTLLDAECRCTKRLALPSETKKRGL